MERVVVENNSLSDDDDEHDRETGNRPGYTGALLDADGIRIKRLEG
ncbi:hypothetical protein [Buttiauxella sp. A111]|nr:hypothetical protein [Buttiauxella sp. A111]